MATGQAQLLPFGAPRYCVKVTSKPGSSTAAAAALVERRLWTKSAQAGRFPRQGRPGYSVVAQAKSRSSSRFDGCILMAKCLLLMYYSSHCFCDCNREDGLPVSLFAPYEGLPPDGKVVCIPMMAAKAPLNCFLSLKLIYVSSAGPHRAGGDLQPRGAEM